MDGTIFWYLLLLFCATLLLALCGAFCVCFCRQIGRYREVELLAKNPSQTQSAAWMGGGGGRVVLMRENGKEPQQQNRRRARSSQTSAIRQQKSKLSASSTSSQSGSSGPKMALPTERDQRATNKGMVRKQFPKEGPNAGAQVQRKLNTTEHRVPIEDSWDPRVVAQVPWPSPAEHEHGVPRQEEEQEQDEQLIPLFSVPIDHHPDPTFADLDVPTLPDPYRTVEVPQQQTSSNSTTVRPTNDQLISVFASPLWRTQLLVLANPIFETAQVSLRDALHACLLAKIVSEMEQMKEIEPKGQESAVLIQKCREFIQVFKENSEAFGDSGKRMIEMAESIEKHIDIPSVRTALIEAIVKMLAELAANAMAEQRKSQQRRKSA